MTRSSRIKVHVSQKEFPMNELILFGAASIEVAVSREYAYLVFLASSSFWIGVSNEHAFLILGTPA